MMSNEEKILKAELLGLSNKLLKIEGPPLKESMSAATQRISNMKQDINHYILGENKKIGGYAQ